MKRFQNRSITAMFTAFMGTGKQYANRYLINTIKALISPLQDKNINEQLDQQANGALKPVQTVDRVIPIYPDRARLNNITGNVDVQVYIDKYGNVTTARVISGHELLQQAAIVAACKSTFAFANNYHPDRPVPVLLTYRFNL